MNSFHTFAPEIYRTMEQKFSNNSLDLETLREFCKREGEAVTYRSGDQLERESAIFAHIYKLGNYGSMFREMYA